MQCHYGKLLSGVYKYMIAHIEVRCKFSTKY